MSFVKKLPWASLALVIFTYGVFGWLYAPRISREYLQWETDVVWKTALVLLISLALTVGVMILRNYIDTLLKSDLSAFITIVVISFVAVIILRWIEISIRILVLVAAGALARLDLQTAGFSQLQAFLMLTFASLAGFGLGLVLNLAILANGRL